jgi:hypothetical protein
MHFKLKLFPYKLGSVSGKALASELGIKRVRPTYEASRRDIVINWGSSAQTVFPFNNNDLNNPSAIALAANKLSTFTKLSQVDYSHLPEWTTSQEEAQAWADNGTKVYCRTLLTSHSGNGIVIVEQGDTVPYAPLYTKDCKHKHEYRIHVFKGEVIDVQQKKRRMDGRSGGTGIRNHSNGWVYARSGVVAPDVITSASITSVNGLGLDFGAVDIGYREVSETAHLLEVNTAPGLVGTTLSKYVDAFNKYLNSLNS